MKYFIIAVLFVISLVYSGYYVYMYDKKVDKKEEKTAFKTPVPVKIPEHLTKKFWDNVTPEQLKEKLKNIKDVNEVRPDKKMNMLHLLSLHSQYFELVPLLVSAGVNYTLQDVKHGATPIHYSLINEKNKSVEFLKQFFKFNVDIDTTSGRGNSSLLIWAVYQRSSIEIIRFLLEKGADPNFKNKWVHTPLIVAFLTNRETGSSFIAPEAIQLLLDYKADIAIKANDGKTAFDYMKENEEFIKTDLFKKLSKKLTDPV